MYFEIESLFLLVILLFLNNVKYQFKSAKYDIITVIEHNI